MPPLILVNGCSGIGTGWSTEFPCHNPYDIINKYGLDQFRFFLLREVSLGNDGDFSETAFKNRINSDLSNNLGNLIQRTLKFLKKNFDGKIPVDLDLSDQNSFPLKDLYKLKNSVGMYMNNFEISKAIDEIIRITTSLNKFMDESKPWDSIKTNTKKAAKDLTILIEGFRVLGIILQPFLPLSSKVLLDIINIDVNFRNFKFLEKKYKIGKDHLINEPKQLFPRYE